MYTVTHILLYIFCFIFQNLLCYILILFTWICCVLLPLIIAVAFYLTCQKWRNKYVQSINQSNCSWVKTKKLIEKIERLHPISNWPKFVAYLARNSKETVFVSRMAWIDIQVTSYLRRPDFHLASPQYWMSTYSSRIKQQETRSELLLSWIESKSACRQNIPYLFHIIRRSHQCCHLVPENYKWHILLIGINRLTVGGGGGGGGGLVVNYSVIILCLLMFCMHRTLSTSREHRWAIFISSIIHNRRIGHICRKESFKSPWMCYNRHAIADIPRLW